MKRTHYLRMILWFGLCLATLSCASSTPSPRSLPRGQKEIQTRPPEKPLEDRTLPAEKPRKESSPRAQASLRLTEQARVLLENGSPNEAIMTFERSVNLNPANGLNYYYMAEAWLSKGQFSKALKFNELAGSYLEESRQWRSKVQVQRKRIHQAMD